MTSENPAESDQAKPATTSHRAHDSREQVEGDVPEDVDLGDAPDGGGPESDDPVGHGHAVAPPG